MIASLLLDERDRLPEILHCPAPARAAIAERWAVLAAHGEGAHSTFVGRVAVPEVKRYRAPPLYHICGYPRLRLN